VLTGLNSSFANASGAGSVLASQMAIEDFGASSKGLSGRVISADHQNKAGIGAAIVRKWLELDRVDAIVDAPNSSVALAANEVVRGKHIALRASSTAKPDLTGPAYSPNVIQSTFDTWSLANSTAKSIRRRHVAFHHFGFHFWHVLQPDATAVVTANGGKVLGAVRPPPNTADFGAFLLQAQASHAKVVGLANSGGDTINSISRAREFGITQTETCRALVFYQRRGRRRPPHRPGPIAHKGIYWDFNQATRAWSSRFAARNSGRMRAPPWPLRWICANAKPRSALSSASVLPTQFVPRPRHTQATPSARAPTARRWARFWSRTVETRR
jgi:branched-chain amino acid transport system substrate-binding protein